MNNTTFIYGLKDPQSENIFYVGKSNRPEARFKAHMYLSGTNRHKINKIKKIVRHGYYPELVILETCTYANWKDREKHWIAYGRSEGWPLTNIVNGGEGVEGATWNYWERVAAPYLNPTRADFINAINDIIHPVNHDAVNRLDFAGLVKLGQKIAMHLIP